MRECKLIAASNSPGTLSVIKTSRISPGAGSDWLYTVPAGKRWRIISGEMSLVCDAVAGTRQVFVVIEDAANHILYDSPGGMNLAASQVGIFNLGVGIPPGLYPVAATPADFVITVSLPVNIILGPGYTIRSITQTLDAADAWTATLWYEEFSDT